MNPAYSPILMTIVFIGIFYFLLIRPQQKKNKQVQQMRENLQVGDNVNTIGGIYGKIINIKDELLTIEVGADRVKLQVSKWAIGSIVKNSVE